MKSLIFLFLVLFFISCKPHVDTIYYNATIYTVNKEDSICQAIAVKDGKIVSIGNKDILLERYNSKNAIDLNGKFVYPGFIDSHCHILSHESPQPGLTEIESNILFTQKKCLEAGLTTVDAVGETKREIDIIDSLQKTGNLKIRIYAMLANDDDTKNYYFKHGIYKTDYLHVCSFIFSVDSALTYWNALLFKPYTDSAKKNGMQLIQADYLKKQAQLCYKTGFQVCTNAIGDSANHLTLRVYGSILKETNNRRWRIEGCQIIAPDDFQSFADYSIVPSVQFTSATDEQKWSSNRIGIYRLKGAYAYRILFYKNGYLANGSNFPEGNINPLYGFYSAVARRDQNGTPSAPFQPENGLTRQQALHAITLWAAKANFEEDEKGSLEEGKFADFVVLDKNIMTIPLEQILSSKVVATYINGEKVFSQ